MNNRWNNLPLEKRLEERNRHLKPMPEAFFAWVKSESDVSLPKSKYGQAMEKYPRNHAALPEEIEEFLPWSKSIPEYAKQPV